MHSGEHFGVGEGGPTIPYNTIPHRTIPYHTIPHSTIPYHTILRCGVLAPDLAPVQNTPGPPGYQRARGASRTGMGPGGPGGSGGPGGQGGQEDQSG